MRARVAAAALVVLFTSVLAFTGGPASAATTECSGTLSGSVGGGVDVPAGSSCSLNGAAVAGGVVVNQGATLSVVNGSDVHGSIVANNAKDVALHDSTVEQNLLIIGLTGGGCTSGLFGSTVKGSVMVQHYTPTDPTALFEVGTGPCGGGQGIQPQEDGVSGNTMGGSLSLQGNSGEVTIVGNIQSNSQSQSTSQISIQSNSGEVIIGGNRLNTQSSHPGQMSIQGDSGPVVISGNQVNDQFTYSGNSAPPPSTANVSQPVSQVSGNVFDESANFVGNRGGGRILNNQVAGSLNCVGNQPNFQASGNSAQVNNCGQGQPPPG